MNTILWQYKFHVFMMYTSTCVSRKQFLGTVLLMSQSVLCKKCCKDLTGLPRGFHRDSIPVLEKVDGDQTERGMQRASGRHSKGWPEWYSSPSFVLVEPPALYSVLKTCIRSNFNKAQFLLLV